MARQLFVGLILLPLLLLVSQVASLTPPEAHRDSRFEPLRYALDLGLGVTTPDLPDAGRAAAGPARAQDTANPYVVAFPTHRYGAFPRADDQPRIENDRLTAPWGGNSGPLAIPRSLRGAVGRPA